MAEFDISQTSRTNLAQTQGDYSPDPQTPDNSYSEEYSYDFPHHAKYTAHYKTNPFLKKGIDGLGNWVTGRGYQTDNRTRFTLEQIRGYGEDTFLSVVRNLLTQKKVQGDCFAEIIRNKDGRLINLKPLYAGDMKIVFGKDGMIKRYEQHVGSSAPKKFKISQIFHSANDRYANEVHGTSVIECVEWMLDAIQEAMRDHRVVLHRNKVPVRIIEIDHHDTTKRDELISEYNQAIKKGEVLVIPRGTVEMKDNTIQIVDPTNWITYLENAIYIAIGVPKVVLGGSSQSTEASAKVDYLTFEEVYNREHEELESDFLNQVGLRITFNKPASLQQQQQESEAANTGQVGFQNNDTQVGVGRQ